MIKEKNLEPVIVFSFSRRCALPYPYLSYCLHYVSVSFFGSLTRADTSQSEHCQLSSLRFS